MAYKVFIDGKEGTTGLKIFERFENRSDIEILSISEELRKDTKERQRFLSLLSDYSSEHLSAQYELSAENYPSFLEYNSYVDCGELFEIVELFIFTFIFCLIQ